MRIPEVRAEAAVEQGGGETRPVPQLLRANGRKIFVSTPKFLDPTALWLMSQDISTLDDDCGRKNPNDLEPPLWP